MCKSVGLDRVTETSRETVVILRCLVRLSIRKPLPFPVRSFQDQGERPSAQFPRAVSAFFTLRPGAKVGLTPMDTEYKFKGDARRALLIRVRSAARLS